MSEGNRVSHKVKGTIKEISIKLFKGKDNGKHFTFIRCKVGFSWSQGARGVMNDVFKVIVVYLGKDTRNAKGGEVSGDGERQGKVRHSKDGIGNKVGA